MQTDKAPNPFADAGKLLDYAAQRVGDLAVTKGKDFTTSDLIEMRAILNAALNAYDPILTNAPMKMQTLSEQDADAEKQPTPAVIKLDGFSRHEVTDTEGNKHIALETA